MRKLTENVFYLNRYPTVGCVVTSEGVVAVDGPMKPTDAVAWRDFMASQGPLRYLIHTEHHSDHICANHFLRGTVIASEVTDALFFQSVSSSEEARERMEKLDPPGAQLLEGYELRRPEVTYRLWLTLRLGGHTFHLIRAPGHTRGQTLVHAEEARVAFTGDNLTPGMHPFFHSAAIGEWFASLDLLESLDVEWYVPGHGDPCRKDEVPRQRRKMQEVIDEVRRLKEQGRTREEAQEGVRYIDRPGLDYPRVLGPRARELERAGVGVIYDQLADGPSV